MVKVIIENGESIMVNDFSWFAYERGGYLENLYAAKKINDIDQYMDYELVTDTLFLEEEKIVFSTSELYPNKSYATLDGDIINENGDKIGFLFINHSMQLVSFTSDDPGNCKSGKWKYYLFDGRGYAKYTNHNGTITTYFSVIYPDRLINSNYGPKSVLESGLLDDLNPGTKIKYSDIAFSFLDKIERIEKSTFYDCINNGWLLYEDERPEVGDLTNYFSLEKYREDPDRQVFFVYADKSFVDIELKGFPVFRYSLIMVDDTLFIDLPLRPLYYAPGRLKVEKNGSVYNNDLELIGSLRFYPESISCMELVLMLLTPLREKTISFTTDQPMGYKYTVQVKKVFEHYLFFLSCNGKGILIVDYLEQDINNLADLIRNKLSFINLYNQDKPLYKLYLPENYKKNKQ